MDRNNLFSRKGFSALLLMALCLFCSCRKMAPLQNAFSVWQNDWQGIPMTAISHSEGLNLFLPPAPVFFASTKSDVQPAPQIRWNELGPASDDLKDYCQAWSAILQRKLPFVMELPTAFSLPLPPWMTILEAEDFQTTARFLYQALGKDGLLSDQKQQLEMLLLFHEQQSQLAEVLIFLDKINHGKDCDFHAALLKFRIFREFQQDFAGYLEGRLLEDLLIPSRMVDELLKPLLALPQLETPLRCLPSLWMAVRETDHSPISAAEKTLEDWRNLNHAPLRFAAIWEDLQESLPETPDGFTWLIMSFDSPQPVPGATFYLISLPLPEQTEVFLNGIPQTCIPHQPFVLQVKAAESPQEEQLIALRFPNASLGTALWPPWLVKCHTR